MHSGTTRGERALESEEHEPASREQPIVEREQDTVKNNHQVGKRAAVLQKWVGNL